MMAASVSSVKVKDRKYKNWLKVSLALLYLKNGIHAFIKSGVISMHENLLWNIYHGKRQRKCTNCYSRDIRWNDAKWEFPYQCKLDCGKWLDELQKLFSSQIDPDQIFWTNSFVQEWPFNAWECAKMYLPQGQQRSNTGPHESDSQALMTLLTNCQHFSKQLSQTSLNLTSDILEIRNNVMHSAAMEVSDADRTTYIQQIICFLQDPVFKTIEECKIGVAKIQKITDPSLDFIGDLDLEISALNAGINEIRLELQMEVKKTVGTTESLKEEYNTLRKMLNNSEKELILHRTSMVTIESNIQQQEKKHQAMETAVTSHEGRLDIVEEDVQYFGKQLQELGINTDTSLQHQENKHEEMDATLTQLSESMETMSADIASYGGKLVACDKNVQSVRREFMEFENNSERKRKAAKELISDNVTSEVTTKRRPESDGLKELKGQTENKLDTFRKMGFIATTQTEEAKKLLQKTGYVVIKGKTGEGKTSTALHLLDNDDYRNQRVVVKSPRQWKKVDTEWVKIVVLEDIFGKYDLDPSRLQEWIEDYLGNIQKHVDVGKLQVIIAIRDDILSKAYSKLKSFKLFFSGMSLTLCSDKLENSEKMSILNRILQRHKKDINVDEKEDCILANFGGLIGFPQCCTLFAGFKDFFDQGPKFFDCPEKCLIDNIVNLKDNSFLSLAFLFCNGEIEEEYLSPSQIKTSKNYLPVLEELAKYLNISFDESTVISLRQSYDHFSGLYVDKVVSYEHHSGGNVRKSIQFSHATVREAVGQILGHRCPEMVVKYGDSEYLYQRTYTAETKDSTSEYIYQRTHTAKPKDSTSEYLYQRSYTEDVSDRTYKYLYLRYLSAETKDSTSEYIHQRTYTAKPKDSTSEYLHQRTYTEEVMDRTYKYLFQRKDAAETKDSSSQNVFIPVSVYGLLAKRMVDDVVEKHLVGRVVNHSALKQHQFLMTLKDELHRSDRIQDFFMGNNPIWFYSNDKDLSEGVCKTFLQYILQKDEDVVRLVYGEFLELLTCTHNNNSSYCWQCAEKHHLMELALYYHHFEIADKLITMNAGYTHVSLCNAARHGNLGRVQTILECIKKSLVLNPECIEAKKALCRAYMSGNQDIVEIVLQEGITLDSKHVVNVVQHGDLNALMKVVEYLKCHNKWNPHLEQYNKLTFFFHPDLYSDTFQDEFDLARLDQIPCSIALYKSYCNEKFDMADYLLKNEAKVSLDLLECVSKYGSQQAVARVIQHLNVTGTWDSHGDDASEALENAYTKEKYNMCDLLIQEGVSLTMKNLPGVVMGINWVLTPFEKAVKHLKDTNSWDPKCDYASEALEKAYSKHKYEICDLLVQEGVTLTMKHLPHMISRSLDYVKTAVNQLKDTDNWDPMCDDASATLEKAYKEQKYDVCDLLVQEGVSLTMKHLPDMISRSLDHVKTAVTQLKDTDSWDPKCDDAFRALGKAFREQKYDVYHQLIQEGISLTLKGAISAFTVSLESVQKLIQQMKITDTWDPKGDDACESLDEAYRLHQYDVCDLLVQEGVSLTMKHLPHLISRSLDDVKTAVQQLKDTDSWDPNCDDASETLYIGYKQQKHDMCDLLIHEGVPLTMKCLTSATCTVKASLESVNKVIQQLKDANSWDPKCDDASEAIGKVYGTQKYDVCDLLIQEGVSVTMTSLTSAISTYRASMDSVVKIIQQLKVTNTWNPRCEEALKALKKAEEVAYRTDKYEVAVLLVQLMLP